MNIEFFKQRARTLRKNGESWHAEDLEFLLAEIERLQVENKDLKQNLASAIRPFYRKIMEQIQKILEDKA